MISGVPYGRLQILIVEANELNQNKRRNSTQPPSYLCRITYKGKKSVELETEVFPVSKHPKWYEEFNVMIDDTAQPVVLTLKEKDQSKATGTVSFNVLNIEPNKRIEEWKDLVGESGGKIKVVYFLTPLSILPGNYEEKSKKLPSFRLDLTGEDEPVDVGGYLEGNITFLTPRPYNLKRIYLRLYGQETVSWLEEDVSLEVNYSGDTTLVNKWYHGWENEKDTVDAGFYSWKFRIKVPENLPPSIDVVMGKITYHVYAYLDHDKYTEGHPIRVRRPVTTTIKTEKKSTQHNMEFLACLDQPVYFRDESPIRIGIDVSVHNFSDYSVKYFKVKIIEKSVFAANNNVISNSQVLFKQTFKDQKIYGHQQWDGKLYADLPPNYRKLTLSKEINATRITISHTLFITVVKDSPISTRAPLELPLTITTKPIHDDGTKKQLISLQKDALVTTPPTPVQPTKKKRGSSRNPKEEITSGFTPMGKTDEDSEDEQEAETFVAKVESSSPAPKITRNKSKAPAPLSFASLLPVPNQLIDFNSPIGNLSPRMSLDYTGPAVTSFSTTYDPFAVLTPTISPFGSNTFPSTTPAFPSTTPTFPSSTTMFPATTPTNPFHSPFAPAPNPLNPFAAPTPSIFVASPHGQPQQQPSYPAEKNPFL